MIVAAAAGVTPMTFIRHLPTKAAVVVSDPYDPVIADAAVTEGTVATEQAIVERLLCGGADQFEARVAAGACLGVATAALLPGDPDLMDRR